VPFVAHAMMTNAVLMVDADFATRLNRQSSKSELKRGGLTKRIRIRGCQLSTI